MAAVTIMGDSNIKHIYVKDFFDAALKTDTIFIQTNTKEALSVAVNKAPKKGKRLVFHCSWPPGGHKGLVPRKTRGQAWL